MTIKTIFTITDEELGKLLKSASVLIPGLTIEVDTKIDHDICLRLTSPEVLDFYKFGLCVGTFLVEKRKMIELAIQ